MAKCSGFEKKTQKIKDLAQYNVSRTDRKRGLLNSLLKKL